MAAPYRRRLTPGGLAKNDIGGQLMLLERHQVSADAGGG